MRLCKSREFKKTKICLSECFISPTRKMIPRGQPKAVAKNDRENNHLRRPFLGESGVEPGLLLLLQQYCRGSYGTLF